MQSLLNSIPVQHHFASVVVQKIWRGHLTRKRLWEFGGIIQVAAALKIQRCWRGYRGRIYAGARMNECVDRKASKIIGLYRIWQTRRIIRTAKAEQYERFAVKIQCLFRGKEQRDRVRRLRFQIKVNCAKAIQRCMRGRFGRIKSKIIRKLINLSWSKLSIIYRQNLASILLKKLKGIESIDFIKQSPWELLHLSLSHLTMTNRAELSLDICSYVSRRYPSLSIASHLSLECILLSSWTSFTKAELIREDFLEESIGRILFRRSQHNNNNNHYSSIDCPAGSLPWLQTNAPGGDLTGFGNSIESAIEACYFQNPIQRYNRSNWKSNVLKAIWLLVSSTGHTHGHEDSTGKLIPGNLSSRVHRLLQYAYRSTSSSAISRECLRHVLIFENIFCSSHRIISNIPMHSFPDFRFVDFEILRYVNKKLKNLSKNNFDAKSNNLKNEKENDFNDRKVLKLVKETLTASINAHLEIVQCGDMIILKAAVNDMKLSCPSEVLKIVGEDITSELNWQFQSPKYNCEGKSASNYVRPFILFPNEVLQLLEYALVYLSKIFKQPIAEVRLRGNLINLADYLIHVVRIVSCSTKFQFENKSNENNSNNDMSFFGIDEEVSNGFRLVIPFVEYKRRERNDKLKDDYCIKIIQRVYRGFKGRSRFRRIFIRTKERERQILKARKELAELSRIYQSRYRLASLIAARVKGILWRIKLSIMKEMALRIQCMYRIYLAKRKVAAEKRRRLNGPEVIEVIKKSVAFSDINQVVITVSRCGNNYRLNGVDYVNDYLYEGFFYQQEIVDLLENTQNDNTNNENIESSTKRIKIWHYESVASLIIANIGVTKMIPIAPSDLERGGKGKGGKKKSHFAFFLKNEKSSSSVSGRGVQAGVPVPLQVRDRTLRDGKYLLDYYNSVMAKKKKRKELSLLENSNNNKGKFVKDNKEYNNTLAKIR